MEQFILQSKRNSVDTAWQQQRHHEIGFRHQLTDCIKAFTEYADEQGSRSASRYYKAITDLCHKTVGIGSGLRDALTPLQLSQLVVVENAAISAISSSMARETPYKEVYQNVKAELECLAIAMGTSTPVTG
ncbi:hypothetical protein [Dongshaea marina]|uniref:hypothetical protein n=1 Tax=Dongshaea marina TaxID=2047966 RepID=UPI000D3E6412|nr:hypothetical protein [Dongshaea marina]